MPSDTLQRYSLAVERGVGERGVGGGGVALLGGTRPGVRRSVPCHPPACTQHGGSLSPSRCGEGPVLRNRGAPGPGPRAGRSEAGPSAGPPCTRLSLRDPMHVCVCVGQDTPAPGSAPLAEQAGPRRRRFPARVATGRLRAGLNGEWPGGPAAPPEAEAAHPRAPRGLPPAVCLLLCVMCEWNSVTVPTCRKTRVRRAWRCARSQAATAPDAHAPRIRRGGCDCFLVALRDSAGFRVRDAWPGPGRSPRGRTIGSLTSFGSDRFHV